MSESNAESHCHGIPAYPEGQIMSGTQVLVVYVPQLLAEVVEARKELSQLRAEVPKELSQLRAEMRKELSQLRAVTAKLCPQAQKSDRASS